MSNGEMLHEKALKILEEPPDKTLFILISENQEIKLAINY